MTLDSSAPAPALILGIGGVVPFIGLAAMTGPGSQQWHIYLRSALSYHGAVLLTFVGAIHLGLRSETQCVARCGAAWLNSAIGHALLAKRMGKPRVITETGAGQHGAAMATSPRAMVWTRVTRWRLQQKSRRA